MADDHPHSEGFLDRMKHRLFPRSRSAPPTRSGSPRPLGLSSENTHGGNASVQEALVSSVASLIHPGARPSSSMSHTSIQAADHTVVRSSTQSDNRSSAHQGELLLRSVTATRLTIIVKVDSTGHKRPAQDSSVALNHGKNMAHSREISIMHVLVRSCFQPQAFGGNITYSFSCQRCSWGHPTLHPDAHEEATGYCRRKPSQDGSDSRKNDHRNQRRSCACCLRITQ